MSWFSTAEFDCLAGCLVGCLVACSGAGETRGEQPVVPAPVEPTLPGATGRFAPAHSQLSADPKSGQISGQQLTRIDACGRCHPDIVRQWSESAHAFASFNNPIYRVSIDGFRERVDARRSRFCAGCHDVALLVDGAMDAPVAADDARAHASINCRVCHGIDGASADGNGSFRLRRIAVPSPDVDNPASVERHRQAVSVDALGVDLCRACHRSFVGSETGNKHHLRGMDDFSDWQRSAHAGNGVGRVDEPIEPRDCIDCHMAEETVGAEEMAASDGRVASHRFPGGHTWLGAMRADTAHTERVARRLRGAASVDIALAIARADAPASEPVQQVRTLLADGAPVLPGGQLDLDIVIRNLQVGHRLPGGVRDAQDVWLEVTVRDREQQLIAQSGVAHADDPDDLDTHVARAIMADETGQLVLERQVDRFAALIVDHSIAPRDVAVVRYAMDVPADVATPLTVRARLLHRSRNLRMQRAACDAHRSPRGIAFADAARAHGRDVLDPCVAQPVTTIAEASASLGTGVAPAPPVAPDQVAPGAWRRPYEHGLAWTHAVQERLDEARPSLEAALAALEGQPDSSARARAMVLTALGQLAGRQGRTEEALSWLARAETLMPEHAAIASARGSALMRVWRWAEAEAPLALATRRAPGNAGAWADLAVTLGSLSRDRDALAAARRGLALEPRHPGLLRVQALSLRALDAPLASAALDAYDRHRKPDRAMDIRFACAARNEHCAREREPVHVHRLHPASERQPAR